MFNRQMPAAGGMVFSLMVAALAPLAAQAQSKPQSVVVTNPSLTVRSADAGQFTHVGQKPSQIVNLETFGSGVFSRIDPAIGQSDRTPWIVPAGYVFVLTQVHGGTGCGDGTNGVFRIRQLTSINTTRDFIPWGCAGNQLFVGFNRYYAPGMLFGAASQILGEGDHNEVVRLEGYLVPAD